MHKFRKYGGIILTTMITLMSIIGCLITDIPLLARIILVLMAAFAIFSLFYDIRQESKRHKFEKDSDKFHKFFSKWYSKPGKLSIICEDLNWIKTDNGSCIYEALKKKCGNKELTLFLGQGTSPDILRELKREGAVIKKAPESIANQYSFSALSYMNNYTNILVRDKQKDGVYRIEFDEVSNIYVTGLLNALIKELNRS